ncbi:MAG: inorganic phosphate transporter [Gammaproteobacteria bacterium]|nr:inorganic phosphate transporter [Gammaproteobacteria bacterium]MBU0772143.1 inorganic phosphate transporter [Gammaproteobacteria bacterium]MBU0854913.1 inorganic phosphate transporter [Gammaproteobacteria bacterium]MBU1848470.1 inorganic phosphate transporter [Gammaproteobacteria bacterium]
MELENYSDIERATRRSRREFFRLGICLLFVVSIMIYAALGIGLQGPGGIMLVVAAMIGGYMAMNIGANDVANNVGPAVGSRAITMGGAVVIAAVFEVAGALIAGGDVTSTIRGGIIDPAGIADSDRFIWVMTAALLAGALWLNLATAFGAPVSTTHSIVGAVLGAGVAAGGMSVARWDTVGAIVASWVVSPLLGGLIAASFLYWIKRGITYRTDMIEAAQRTVPVLLGLMAMSFTTYLMLKGLNKVWKVDFPTACATGAALGAVTWMLVRMRLRFIAYRLTNTKQSINSLFSLPLIFAAALLSFAHGANDVANAIGPLAAITDTVLHGTVSDKAGIPLWVMMVGAIGIAIGLALYGPRLIRTVGHEITELDQMRAFSIAMAAALTVIVASQLGLPVSSTHIALGGVFGVGFLREYIKTSYAQTLDEIRSHHQGADKDIVDAFLKDFEKADKKVKRAMLDSLKAHTAQAHLSKHERKAIKRTHRHELVKRSALFKIAAAWIITVPASALMAAMIYYMIFGIVHA